jgi:hypothetical protein
MGTASSNSLRSAIQPVGLCAYRRIGGGCEIGCLYRYDEYNEGNLPCTTRIGEEMGGLPVHYLLVDALGLLIVTFLVLAYEFWRISHL